MSIADNNGYGWLFPSGHPLIAPGLSSWHLNRSIAGPQARPGRGDCALEVL